MITRMALACLCLFSSFITFAGTITAIQNGNWMAATTWDAGRAPLDNDQVIIPASRTVDFSGSPYPKNTPTVRPTLTIKIYGTLDFSAVGNDKLYLDAGSAIQIFSGGKIQTTTSSSEIVAIYNGSDDNTVWSGTPATLNGPLNATATTSGFANGILPVKLESFSIRKDSKGFATLTWITSAEINSSRFEIERSPASAGWQYAGSVTAAGNSFSNHEYNFAAPLYTGENRFRIKQIDIDGKFTYSHVMSVRFDEENKVIVAYNQSTHLISLRGIDNGNAKILIADAAGNRLYTGTSSSFIFAPATSGIYFVNVVNSHSRVAKKIMVH